MVANGAASKDDVVLTIGASRRVRSKRQRRGGGNIDRGEGLNKCHFATVQTDGTFANVTQERGIAIVDPVHFT